MVYVPKVIRKVAGSAADQAWAYVVDWHKNGKPDDEVSEPVLRDKEALDLQGTTLSSIARITFPSS